MGGGLVLTLGCLRPDKIKAVVPFYGVVGFDDDGHPDWSKLEAPVQGHYGEKDDFFGPDAAKALESKLQGMGKDCTITVHPGTGHAFMGSHNALGTYDEQLADKLWPQVVSFLHEKLG